jgi:hypothetical protein
MAVSDAAVDLAAAVGQKLPAEYLSFLDGVPARPTLGERYGPILDFGDHRWRPYTRTRLAEAIPHRRREAAFPYAHETARHVTMLRAADEAHGGEASGVLVKQGFALDRLARGFCIGDDGNGAPTICGSGHGWRVCVLPRRHGREAGSRIAGRTGGWIARLARQRRRRTRDCSGRRSLTLVSTLSGPVAPRRASAAAERVR